MSSNYLTIKVKFDMRDGSYEIDSDVKPEKQSDMINEFIMSQMGAGEDTRKPNVQDVYNITIQYHFDDDSFRSKSDTGNNGLREGILMDVARRLVADQAKKEDDDTANKFWRESKEGS